MKKLIVLAAALATVLAGATSAEARDRGYGRHHQGYRHGGHGAPRYHYTHRRACPPPVYYAPRHCAPRYYAPRPVCPPRHSYYGAHQPNLQLSFSFGGGGRYRW